MTLKKTLLTLAALAAAAALFFAGMRLGVWVAGG